MGLRRRLIGAFALVALPASVGSLAALELIDDTVREEIERRGAEIVDGTEQVLLEERKEVARRLAAAAEDPTLLRILAGPLDAEARTRLEPWTSELATLHQLDLLALAVEEDDGELRLVSSAHLPLAVGDQVPAWMRGGGTSAGFGSEMVSGNPPHPVPALLARLPVPSPRRVVALYGGRRLDGRLLGRLAQMTGARFELLRGPKRWGRFPDSAAPEQGADPVPVPVASIDGGPSAELWVRVDTDRLWAARGRLQWLTFWLLLTSGALAVVLGFGLSALITRPIEALAQAAERIGAGDLQVRVQVRARDEVGRLVGAFNTMAAELAETRTRAQRAERKAAWREVARRLAHEIRNPLSPMRLGMENLRKAWRKQHPALGEIVEESTASVLESVQSLDRLVTDFVQLARLPTPEPVPTDAMELLERVARRFSPAIPLANTESEALPMVHADPEAIGRALMNLVKNAREAQAAAGLEGRVELSARPAVEGGRAGLWLEVRDDGPGMSPELLERARSVYFTTKASGTGLGLAIVERIAEESDGHFVLESAVDVGTTAGIWLPRVAASHPQPTSAERSEPREPPTAP